MPIIGICQLQLPQAFTEFDRIYSQALDSAYDEYNFWNGHWSVNWKAWKEGDTYTSLGTPNDHRVFSALDGKAMIELAYNDEVFKGSKTAGFSIRYFDANLNKWVMLQSWPGINSPNISSLQGTHNLGRIQLYQQGITSPTSSNYPPNTSFVNRYTFSDVRPESFRWDSSVSVDSMKTWHTGSIAEFVRVADFESLRTPDTDYWFTYGDGYNCDDTILKDIRPYLGEWQGVIEIQDKVKPNSGKVTRVLVPFLSNCAALGYQIIENGENLTKEILFATYLPNSSEWVFYVLNNAMGESQSLYFTDSLKSDGAKFNKRTSFNIPSSNSVETYQWKSDQNKQEVSAYSVNHHLIYKLVLEKID